MRHDLASGRSSFWTRVAVGTFASSCVIAAGTVGGTSLFACTVQEEGQAEGPNASGESDDTSRSREQHDGSDVTEDGASPDGGSGHDDDAGGDAAREAGPSTSGCGAPITPGSTNKTILVNGVERRYLKDVPAGLGPTTPVPIIVGFHGGSDTAENARAYMQLTSTDAAIYVYPQAPFWPEAGGVAWNVDPAGVDFPFIDAMLEELGKDHCVDKSRVFATGKSNGGFFVNSLACYRAGVFRAVAIVAGGGPQSNCAQGMAAMIVHGTADTAVRPEQGEYSRDFWRLKNGCGDGSQPTDPSPCVAYSGCTKPVLWCQHGGAHIWPAWTGAGVRNFFLGM